MSIVVPPVAFLGVVERAAPVRDGNTNLFKHNLLGLKRNVLSFLFPLNSGAFHYAIAIYAPQVYTPLKLRMKDEAGNEIVTWNIGFEPLATPEPTLEDMAIKREGSVMPAPDEGWAFMLIPPKSSAAMIPSPGLYTFSIVLAEQESTIGQLNFILIEPEPLSTSRIAAIRSNPIAAKAVRSEIRCNSCGDAIRTYAGLERGPKSEAEGYVWYENLPDSFLCSCNRTRCDLSIYRRNLHGLLGRPINPPDEEAFLPLYEKGALATIRINFAALLEQKAPEETFQSFLYAAHTKKWIQRIQPSTLPFISELR